ncbi:helix-hairpin-helix domain-containing protein [Pseudodesulfovibrio thermohalotolerans]|uniref:ComEA family DNA-binding protein n=1 Tax=Pseudodesulfovibrio thermohalotolerans TaxID=2880651 RepID=UPI0022BA0CF5|nr:helix-hairpin-helix domain-containing protein [Pseudodesulfovibrio thermohalotolerans]WFS61793.1 helix-hairpin-helix domain-containing protein [Pseudodesulfovibrio thermohalotolerans]
MKKLIITLCLAAMCMVFAGTAFAQDGIVSFNTASVEDLMAIEDIDVPEELAKAIVDYRKANGAFKSAEDMLKVPGMTQDFMEELNPQVTEDGDVVFDPDAEPALAPSKC